MLSLFVLLLVVGMPTVTFGAAWSNRAPTPTPRSPLIAEAIDGLIYAGQGASPGGSSNGRFDRYDLATDSWVQRTKVRDTYGRASAVVSGKIYSFGGVDHGVPLSNVEVYDPLTNSWAPRASMPTPKSGAAAAVVDGKIYVFGGYTAYGNGGSPATTAHEVYDPVMNTWNTRANAQAPAEPLCCCGERENLRVWGQ